MIQCWKKGVEHLFLEFSLEAYICCVTSKHIFWYISKLTRHFLMHFFCTAAMGNTISIHTIKNIMKYTHELHNPLKSYHWQTQSFIFVSNSSHSRANQCEYRISLRHSSWNCNLATSCNSPWHISIWPGQAENMVLQRPFLQKWINFDPRMDEQSHTQWSVVSNYLSILKLQRCTV